MATGKSPHKYRPQWGVIVICQDEAHQRLVYEQLRQAGHQVKVVCV